jgi:hypothetical protein
MPPTFSEAPPRIGKAPPKFQKNSFPDHPATQSPRRRRFSKSVVSKLASGRELTRKGSSEGRSGENTQEAAVALGEQVLSIRLDSVENQQTITEDVTQEEFDELELQQMILEEANASVKSRHQTPSQHTSDGDLRRNKI